jgi:hypothetical protein
MTERSLLAYDNWKTAQEKFDYFILGVIGALCAYVSQNIKLVPLGLNSSTFELAALLVLVGSGVAGFLRLQVSVQLYSLNHHRLYLGERKGQLVSKYKGGPMLNTQTGARLSSRDVLVEVGAIDERLPDIDKTMKRLTARTSLFQKAFPYERLCVSLIPHSEPVAAEAAELEAYCKRF